MFRFRTKFSINSFCKYIVFRGDRCHSITCVYTYSNWLRKTFRVLSLFKCNISIPSSIIRTLTHEKFIIYTLFVRIPVYSCIFFISLIENNNFLHLFLSRRGIRKGHAGIFSVQIRNSIHFENCCFSCSNAKHFQAFYLIASKQIERIVCETNKWANLP